MRSSGKKIVLSIGGIPIRRGGSVSYTHLDVYKRQEFNSLSEMETKHEELNLGDIISDAYVYAVENVGDSDGEKVDVAIVPAGTVRDTYTKGNITVEQVYNSFSLGTGKDGLAGYPLISAYLTGKELKTVAEVDASISDFMETVVTICNILELSNHYK